jgi:hypothetical protein
MTDVLTLSCTPSDDGFAGIIYLVTVGPLLFLAAGIAWLTLAAKASGLRRLGYVIAFLLLFPIPIAAIAAPTAAFIATHDAEDLITWHFGGKRTRVPEEMTTKPGLPHAVWRQWGFLSVWTVAYLVFDETDALASFAFRGGDVPGVPCGVWHVLPLQKQWYVVTLYSEQTWDVC